MDFKNKFKKYRLDNNWTQKEFSDKLGVSRTSVTETESGKNKATLKTVEKLAVLSNKSLSYWLETDNEKNYKEYKPVDTMLITLINSGVIKKDGKIDALGSKIIMASIETYIIGNLIHGIYDDDEEEVL